MTTQPIQHERNLTARYLVIGTAIVAALVLVWLASGREIVPGVTERPLAPVWLTGTQSAGRLCWPAHDKT